ncbi:hypothetical protein SAMN05444410_12424 [Hydrobacter penzbergensis]|uniref:Uncharacterized protein n=1 Tax=Hydrobacter penzbergensis TaxID=1235997 RepID=A0A8X8II23_9BACT|nr:hypothetical protein SAMN05444410_12424 [Hydrobacter penzbergensis]
MGRGDNKIFFVFYLLTARNARGACIWIPVALINFKDFLNPDNHVNSHLILAFIPIIKPIIHEYS